MRSLSPQPLRSLARTGVLGAAASVWLLAAAGGAQADRCSFFDAGSGELAEGACSLTQDGNAETITIGTKRVVFVVTQRQGQWALGALDGRPAIRYEIDRETFSYATQDLKQFVDRSSD